MNNGYKVVEVAVMRDKTTTYNGSNFSDDLNFLKFGILVFDRLNQNTLTMPENRNYPPSFITYIQGRTGH